MPPARASHAAALWFPCATALLLVACGPVSRGGAAPTSASSAGPPIAVAEAALAPCAEPSFERVSPDHARERDAALDRLLGGDARGAARAFERLVRAHPTDVASTALELASEAAAASSWRARLVEAQRTKSVRAQLGAVRPGAHASLPPLDLPASTAPTLRLERIERSPLPTTDTVHQQRELDGEPRVPDGERSSATTFRGHPLLHATRAPGLEVDVFRGHLVVVSRGQGDPGRSFDLGALSSGDDESMLGQVSIVGAYAIGAFIPPSPNDTVPGSAGWLVAWELETGALRWSTDAGTAGSNSFVVVGAHAIAGTGVVQLAATDGTPLRATGALGVVDLRTGDTLSTLDLGFYPQSVVLHEGVVRARGLAGEEAIVTLSTTPAAIPPALWPAPATPPEARAPAVEAPLRCRVRRAIAALDARDGEAAVTAVRDVPRDESPATNAAEALSGAGEFIARAAARPDDTIDLTSAAPIAVPSPPAVRAAASPPRTSKVKLVSKEVVSLEPPRTLVASLTSATSQVRFERPDVPMRGREGNIAPPRYAGRALRSTERSASGDEVLRYGDAFVVVLRKGKPLRILDVRALVGEPAAPGAPARFVADAQLHRASSGNDRLLVSVVQPGPRTELGGEKDILYAVDVETGAIVFASAPLVSSASFAILGERVVTASGYDGEKCVASVLSARDGAILATTPIGGRPLAVGLGYGETVTVRSTDEYAVLEIRDEP